MKANFFQHHQTKTSGIKFLDIYLALSRYEQDRNFMKTGIFLACIDRIFSMHDFYYQLKNFYNKYNPENMKNIGCYLTEDQITELGKIVHASEVGPNSFNMEIVTLRDTLTELLFSHKAKDFRPTFGPQT